MPDSLFSDSSTSWYLIGFANYDGLLIHGALSSVGLCF